MEVATTSLGLVDFGTIRTLQLRREPANDVAFSLHLATDEALSEETLGLAT
jgi:hypothetical protein